MAFLQFAETSTYAMRKSSVRSMVNHTSNSLVNVEPYAVPLPFNINIFSNLKVNLSELENSVVAEQVKQVLVKLYHALKRENEQKIIDNYLSRLNLVQQENKAALLEWNFQDFRVGFALEPDKRQSSYFIVSQDKTSESFTMDAQMLNPELSHSVDRIVDYVLGNT